MLSNESAKSRPAPGPSRRPAVLGGEPLFRSDVFVTRPVMPDPAAYAELGLERMYLHTLAWNYRAQRCFEHAGFKRVRHVNRGGHEFILMDITEDEVSAT